jgi:hypothetical protein
MKKIITKSLVALLFFSVSASAQTHLEMLAWLKKNITTYYVSQPNTPDPDFIKVNYDIINKNIDNVFFGKTSNNGMDNSSQLLLALFRTKADEKFVATIYYAMQIAQKPIDIFLLNDLKGINNEFLQNYAIYTVSDKQKRNFVWPAAYSRADAPEANRALIMGEKNSIDLPHLKDVFIEMVAGLQLRQYGPVRKIMFETTQHDENFHELVLGFPYNDIRESANRGVANAFVLYYNPRLRKLGYRWTNETHMFLYAGVPDPDIPKEFLFRQQFLNEKKAIQGAKITNPPFDIPVAVSRDYRKYSEMEFLDVVPSHKYVVRSDLALGIVLYQLIEKFGLKNFVEALQFDNNRFLNSSYEKKTGILFENFSLARLGGKTFVDLAKMKEYSKLGECYIIALYDLLGPHSYLNASSALASDFAEEFETSTGKRISEGEAEDIIPYYLSTWHGPLRNAVQGMKVPPAQSFFEAASNSIAKAMGLPVPVR